MITDPKVFFLVVKNDVSSYKNDDDIFKDMRKATPELLLYSFLIKIVTYLVHKILHFAVKLKRKNSQQSHF